MPGQSHFIIIIINTHGQNQVLTRKKLIFHFEIKSLQNYKVSKQLWHWNGILRDPQVLIGLAKLFYTSAANQNQGVKAFAVNAFLDWPARRRVLQRAVCHLAAPIDNNRELRHVTFTSHGRQREMCSFPLQLVSTLPHLYCQVSFD